MSSSSQHVACYILWEWFSAKSIHVKVTTKIYENKLLRYKKNRKQDMKRGNSQKWTIVLLFKYYSFSKMVTAWARKTRLLLRANWQKKKNSQQPWERIPPLAKPRYLRHVNNPSQHLQTTSRYCCKYDIRIYTLNYEVFKLKTCRNYTFFYFELLESENNFNHLCDVYRNVKRSNQ